MKEADIRDRTGFGMLDERRDKICVFETALNSEPMALTAVRDGGPGAYLLLHSGPVACFSRARRPGGRSATGSISLDGGWPIYAGSAKSLRERIAGRHHTSISRVVDFDVDDFSVVILPTQSWAAANYAELLLLASDAFGVPALNGPVKGFGSKHQGKSRTTQRISEFNVLFPGRAASTGATNVTAAELHDRVVAHLERTVPDMATTACRTIANGPQQQATTAKVLRFPRPE